MPYIPTIVIKKADLELYAKCLREDWEWSEEETQVLKYLQEVFYTYPTPKIDDIELLICEPEHSDLNQKVRDLLTKWKVQYSLDY